MVKKKNEEKIEKPPQKKTTKKPKTSIKEDKNMEDTEEYEIADIEDTSETVNSGVEVSTSETVVYTHVDVRL